jgi:uncharacterized protein DUF4340
MNWKTLTVLVLLAAGLGGFFAYDTYWLAPAREKTEAVKGRLWEVEAKDIEAVTIKRKTDTIKVKHAADGGWELLEPVKARGDRSAIDGIVTTLVTARVDREIDPKPAKLAEFGLEPPDAEITVEVKGRKDPLVLLIGGKNPTGVWVYGKEGSKPAVLALSEIVFRDMSRPVVELRDKTVLAFDRKSVSGLDVEAGGDRFSVEAQDAGKWKIVKPGPYPGDGDLIAEFLDKLEGAKAKEFIAEPGTSLAKYGLDRPATVTIWLGKDKERSSKALAFGRLDPEKKGVYLMRPGEPEVMLAGEELWTAVPKTVAALRDKVVIAYAYDKLTRVEVESPKGPLTLERAGSAWKLTAPEALKADPAAVNNLLWRVRDLRSAGFLAEEPAAIARYLAKPEVTVRLWEEGAKEPKTLLLGPSKETRGGQPAAVAAVAGQGPVMLVDGKVLQDLARTGDDLRDRLMLGFEVADVKRARLTAAGKMVLVERKGDSEWKVLEPKAGAAKENKVTDLLLTMKALRWKGIVSQKGDDAAKFGLDRPEVELTLLKADGSEIGGLLLGREEGGVTYVKLKASPTIYSVDSRLVADLRKGPTDIPG